MKKTLLISLSAAVALLLAGPLQGQLKLSQLPTTTTLSDFDVFVVNHSFSGTATTATITLGYLKPIIIGTPLTGFTSTTGTVTSADTILSAVQKLAGNGAANTTNIATNTTNIANNTTAIAGKQDALGFPTSNGQVLARNTSGPPFWIVDSGGGGGSSDWNALTNKPLESTLLNSRIAAPPTDPVSYVLNPWDLWPTQSNDQGSFPTSGWTFIVTTSPGALPAYDAYVGSFTVDLVSAETGRQVEFYILNPADSYRVKYASGLQAAASAGNFTYTPTAPIPISAGWVVGVYIGNTSTAKGIHYRASGGGSVATGGDVTGRLTLNSTYSPNAELPQRQFYVSAQILSPTLMVGRQWENKFNGYVGVGPGNMVMPWLGKKIAWYGTSIPANYGDNSYPAQVGRALGCTMLNEAKGSSGIIYDPARCDSLSATHAEMDTNCGAGTWIGRSYEDLLLGKGADLVVFDHGYNDRTYPIGTITSTDKTTFYGAYNFLINALYADNPNVKIIFVTPPSNHATGNNSTQVDAIRTAIYNMADRWNAPVIDLQKLCTFNATNDTLWFPDGVHPSQAATDQIARVLFNRIKDM